MGCTGLKHIEVSPNNPVYDSRGGCNAVMETASNSLIVGCALTIIPDDCERIGDYAFRGMKISQISMPDEINYIGKFAFADCHNLVNVNLPANLTEVSDGIFKGCYSLYHVEIPSKVNSIGAEAFWGCSSLKETLIPRSVTKIGNSESGDVFSYCSSLQKIVVEKGNKVYDSRKNCNAIIESASGVLISGSNESVIPNGVTSIGADAFCGRMGLSEICIPSSVKNINPTAFMDCSALARIQVSKRNPVYDSRGNGNTIMETATNNLVIGGGESSIPVGTKAVGEYAFAGRKNIRHITIPDCVDSLGDCAFLNCSSLNTISMPKEMKHIGDMAFGHCSSLQEIVVPTGIDVINSRVFYWCTSLHQVTLPEGLLKIRSEAFRGCASLRAIELPYGFGKTICLADGVFSDCPSLKFVGLNVDEPCVEASAFDTLEEDNSYTIYYNPSFPFLPSEGFVIPEVKNLYGKYF